MKSKSVVLLSGGMDSTVAYYWALEHTIVQKVLWFEFGQRNALWEAKAVSQIASTCVVQKVVLPHLWHGQRKPARNMVFISAAVVGAGYSGADMIVGGWSAVDTPEYPDCNLKFLDAAALASALALGRFISVISPVIDKSKAEVIEMGDRYGIDWKLTRSCYTEHEEPCGVCAACKYRREALEYHGHSFS